MTEIDMPRHVDDQPQYLFWEMDEVVLVIAFCCIGVLVEALISMGLLGLVAARLLRRNKLTQLPGLTTHIAYWIGLVSMSSVFKNGAVRELVA